MGYSTFENLAILFFFIINFIIFYINRQKCNEKFTNLRQDDVDKILQFESDMKSFINKNSYSPIEMGIEFNNNTINEFNLPINFNEYVTIKI